jgi:hypothetical protein
MLGLLDKCKIFAYLCLDNFTMKVTDKIENQVNQFQEGTTFTYRQLDIEPSEFGAAAKAIERFLKKGLISRASTGLFYKPRKTVFGELKPNEEELLKPYLFEGNKRIAYITGTALYNKLGLTTQIPKIYKIASRSKRIDAQIGNIKIQDVKSYVDVTNDNFYLLEILDVLKDFKKIPDIDRDIAIRYIYNRINDFSESDQEKLIRIALKYPPRVRALLGAIFEFFKSTIKLDSLKKSINPLSVYNYGITQKQLPTIKYWNIE